MEPLHWERGYAHLLFVNPDDRCFTGHPVELSFEKFMSYKLRKQQTRPIRHICFADHELNVSFADDEGGRKLEEAGRGGWSLMSLFHKETDEFGDIRAAASIAKKGNTAVIIDAGAVCKLLAAKETRKILEEFTDTRNGTNYFIVKCPVDMSDLRTLVNENGIFLAPQLGGEIVKFVTDDVMYCFLAEEILARDKNKDRTVFLNTLSLEDIENMIRCFCMKYKKPQEFSPREIKWTAAVIFGWHWSTLFRCCTNLRLRWNPMRKMNIIWEEIKGQDVFEQLQRLAGNIADSYDDDIDSYISDLDIDQSDCNRFFHDTDGESDVLSDGIRNICRTYGLGGGAFDLAGYRYIKEKLAPIIRAEAQLSRILVRNNPNQNGENILRECLEQFNKTFCGSLDAEAIQRAVSFMYDDREISFAVFFERAVCRYFELAEKYRPGGSNDVLIPEAKCKLEINQMRLCRAAAVNTELYEKGVADYLRVVTKDVTAVNKSITTFLNYNNI